MDPFGPLARRGGAAAFARASRPPRPSVVDTENVETRCWSATYLISRSATVPGL
jgi:ferric-dicitrate binding protein FerR (iron transport regulator)